MIKGRVACMDCRCNGDGTCPGETRAYQASWHAQMGESDRPRLPRSEMTKTADAFRAKHSWIRDVPFKSSRT